MPQGRLHTEPVIRSNILHMHLHPAPCTLHPAPCTCTCTCTCTTLCTFSSGEMGGGAEVLDLRDSHVPHGRRQLRCRFPQTEAAGRIIYTFLLLPLSSLLPTHLPVSSLILFLCIPLVHSSLFISTFAGPQDVPEDTETDCCWRLKLRLDH